MRVLALALLAVLPLLQFAHAHHKSTADISLITPMGPSPAPRVMSYGRYFLVAAWDGARHLIQRVRRINTITGFVPTPVGSTGDDANPAIDGAGRWMAWDSTVAGVSGRHIFLKNGVLGPTAQLTTHPTGSCTNPAMDSKWRSMGFECDYDVLNSGVAAVRRVVRYARGLPFPVSTGHGVSRNVTFSPEGQFLAYASTDDPLDGHDTGVSQIWIQQLTGSQAVHMPITNGAGPSRNPSLSSRGRVVAFESTADLAGDGHDTGVPQIFIRESRTNTFARLTDHPTGCTGPTVLKSGTDYYVSFVCQNDPYVYEVRADRLLHYVTPAGSTEAVGFTYSRHFMLVSTTADLLGGGAPSPAPRVYVWNTYRKPGAILAGNAQWFPFRGLSPL